MIVIKFELLANVKMVLDWENGIRGGIARAIYYCKEANDNDTKKTHTFLILISTTNTDGLYWNHFLMVDLHMLKRYQC